MCLAHDWNAKNHDRWWQLVFASILQVRPSREILAKHSVLLFCHIWYTISLPTLYIPTLLTYFAIPTILYLIHCSFFQLLLLHIQILERLIVKTRTIPILSVKWGFDVAGKHWKKLFVWWMQSGWIVWSRELKKKRLHQVRVD